MYIVNNGVHLLYNKYESVKMLLGPFCFEKGRIEDIIMEPEQLNTYIQEDHPLNGRYKILLLNGQTLYVVSFEGDGGQLVAMEKEIKSIKQNSLMN